MSHDSGEAGYQPGQVWRYKTRDGENASTLTVLAIEAHPTVGNIVHICVERLIFKSIDTPEGNLNRIAHMPFGEGAIDSSVTELVATTSVLPDFGEGYNEWKESFEAGDAGIFIIPVKEAVEFVEKALGQE